MKKMQENHVKPTPRMTYRDYITEIWLVVYCRKIADLSPNTIVGYRQKLLAHVIPVVGDIPVNALDRDHVLALYDTICEKKLAPSTRKHIFRIFSKTLTDANFLFRIIDHNPCANFRIRERQNRDYHWIGNSAEMNYYLKCWQETDLYLAIYITLLTGLRRSELLALRWDDIDLEDGVMRIRRVLIQDLDGQYIFRESLKNGATEKKLLLPKKLLKYLRDEYDQSEPDGQDLVIKTRKGNPWNPSSFSRHFGDVRRTLPVDQKIRYHDLRHSNGTYLVNQGVDVKIVAERLGHSDPLTTIRHYVHKDLRDQNRAIDYLDF